MVQIISYKQNIFFASLDNILSEVGSINGGVMILSLFLFLLYVNDIPQALSNISAYLYTDVNHAKYCTSIKMSVR